MLWVSYSCMIVFFGAEFTKQYATHNGDQIKPKQGAELIIPDEQQRRVQEKNEALRRHEKKEDRS